MQKKKMFYFEVAVLVSKLFVQNFFYFTTFQDQIFWDPDVFFSKNAAQESHVCYGMPWNFVKLGRTIHVQQVSNG